jgi:predicted PurR-regulated permease PerM
MNGPLAGFVRALARPLGALLVRTKDAYAYLDMERSRAMSWVALIFFVAAFATLVPLWASLVLGAWFAMLCRPIVARFERPLRGRSRAAALVTIGLFVLIVAPIALAIFALYGAALEFAQYLSSTTDPSALLRGLASGEEANSTTMQSIVKLVQSYGARAWTLIGSVTGATASFVIGLFVFLYATFVFLVHGAEIGAWIEEHAPIPANATRRLGAAFEETGRGLLIATGLTALTQGAIATIAYVVLGVPRAIILGLFTALAALIPSVGTGLVWVPVAVGLALAGRTSAAIAMAAIGILVIGTVDNIVRPFFSRYGQLHMPAFLILVSILGGFALFGAFGIILGPLAVRMAMEALALVRERRDRENSVGDARD